ncbi:MAG: hypothetical protein C5B52_13745 [Bacteroidetes bacterium]|nr:MAG: hypothetical protein C5B52_13745 [Bacteroidota bacterium]
MATLLSLFISCNAQSTSKGYLLALSKTDHTLAIVDPATLNVLGKVPVGIDPHEVIASTDGKTAYVTIYGGGSLHEINVIDVISKKALSTIDTRPLYGPHGIVFVNGYVWFSAEGSKAVGRYDPQANKIDWSMGTGQERTHMIYVTPDLKKIYTTNIASGTVSILSATSIPPPPNAPATAKPREDWTQILVPVSKGSEGFDVLGDSTELWTASGQDGVISIVDLKTNSLASKIDANVVGANRLRFTPDGKMALISSLRSGDLTVYDVKTRKEIKKVKMGGAGAAGIEFDPNGSRAFVACTPDNFIVVIDLKSLEVTSKINVGGGPDGMAWAHVQ